MFAFFSTNNKYQTETYVDVSDSDIDNSDRNGERLSIDLSDQPEIDKEPVHLENQLAVAV